MLTWSTTYGRVDEKTVTEVEADHMAAVLMLSLLVC